ncbi:hypothetical protein DACRYDRAFT_103932 [Dacryopinax primogenitus]|uniref:Uncharacterized protein n=1 Tax=Dacryopinax primogenitus (strain DJM 731) TaxID=1858805 RepID=M5GEI3_DACPD|nr:uncharacterized protein DACRYDRAFT_103932 [Dacryopinax primogenitus]EJU05447.1 hypothetical protein DACRYDRAFT_103932 [Dacryopinax primogenitus]
MAPSSTSAASSKKPLSTKTKPKASLIKKPSTTDMKKGSRSQKASGKKTQSKELTPELEPVANHPESIAKLVSMKVMPSKKASAPPSKTLTLKLRVSLTCSSRRVKQELEAHKEPEEGQEVKAVTKWHKVEEEDQVMDEIIVKETTLEPAGSDEEQEPPSKDLPEILAMVPAPNEDPEAWQKVSRVSKFWVELIKWITKNNSKEQWQFVPPMAASYMGPAFKVQWYAYMGKQITVKLATCGGPVYLLFEEWVEMPRMAVVGRDDKPPFDTWVLRHQADHKAVHASDKEPDENLEATIEAKQGVWNVLPEIKKTQHLNIVQMYQMAGIEGSPVLPDLKVVTPVPLPKKATLLRVSISATASLPSLPPKSLSVVELMPAPNNNKKKTGKTPKNKLSEELLALAAKAKPDLLSASDGVLWSL